MKVIKGARRAFLNEDARLPYEGMSLSSEERELLSEARMFAGLEGTRDHAIQHLIENKRREGYTISEAVNEGIKREGQMLNENVTSGIIMPEVLGVVNSMSGFADVDEGVDAEELAQEDFDAEGDVVSEEQEELAEFLRSLGEEFDLELPEGLAEMTKEEIRAEKVKEKVKNYYMQSDKGGKGNLTPKQREKAGKVKEKVKQSRQESQEADASLLESAGEDTGIKNVFAKQTTCAGKPAIRFEDRRGAHLGTFHILSDGTLKESRVGRQAPRATRNRLMEQVGHHNVGVTTLVESAISKARQRAIAEAVTGFLKPLLRG